MNCDDFLFPRDLERSASGLKNVLIVGSCLAECYMHYSRRNTPDINIDYILFSHAWELPDPPPRPVQDYDFQYLQIPLRSLLTDRLVHYADLTEELYASITESAFATLDASLHTGLAYARKYGLLTFVSNFVVPQREVARTISASQSKYNVTTLIEDLNRHLSRRCQDYQNVFVADTEGAASSFGKNRFLDDWWHIYSHSATMHANWAEGIEPPFYLNTPIARADSFHPVEDHQFHGLIWRQLEAMFRSVRQIDQVKLVVFDLDNTLWRGQIAEHYGEGMDWPNSGGWPEGLAEAVHHLRARGILVALCSRNDESLVRNRWARAMPDGRLSLDDFVISKINFRSKADNIAEILQILQLTPKGVVFVDDNPVEREDVVSRFPDIRVIGDNQFHTRRILLWAPETQVSVLTTESQRREEMVKQQVVREGERAALSREEFLANLGCEVTILEIDGPGHPAFARAVELLNKTNQFNTTGRRWPTSDLMEFLTHGKLFAFGVKDKFVDYGIVGAILISNDRIDQYVLSCRVLGMEVETSALHKIMWTVGKKGQEFAGSISETEANIVSRDVFARAGFIEVDSGEFIYTLDGAPMIAPHLTIEMTDVAMVPAGD